MAAIEDDLRDISKDAKDKWEQTRSLVDPYTWEPPAFDDIAQLASEEEITMILRVALYFVDDLAILPKLSVESLSGLMRDAMAFNQNRRPTQQDAAPSTSGSQMRVGEIADLRAAYDELKQELHEVKEKAAEDLKPIERLQAEVDGMVGERADLVAKLNNANRTCTKEKKQFETSQAMLDELTAMNNKIQDKYNNLKTIHKELLGK
jgi:hypothetical protein